MLTYDSLSRAKERAQKVKTKKEKSQSAVTVHVSLHQFTLFSSALI